MYATVNDITGPADQLDEAIAGFKEEVVPRVQAMDGLARGYLLLDRDNGRTIGITVWETEETLRASEETATGLRSSASEWATSVDVSRYQVVVSKPQS
jgi:heme-degrading monooxygenase HmoA